MKFIVVDDEHELYKVMFNDLFKCKDYDVEELPKFRNSNKLISKFRNIHFNEFINRHFWLPGKSLWNKRYVLSSYEFDENEQYYIIFLNGTLRFFYSYRYLDEFKKKHKNVKLVIIMYDSFSNSFAQRAISFLPMFDIIFSFDAKDCETYGFEHIYSTFSRPDFIEKQSNIESNVYSTGVAVGRLDMMHKCFYYIASQVKKCEFTIVGVPSKNQLYPQHIKYNQPLTYKEVLMRSFNTKCLVEVLKEGQSGITLRTCEAILFNKKLVTNNINIKKMPFFDERFMKVFTNPEDIDINFITEDIDVNYDYKDYFSPLIIIDRILKKNSIQKNNILIEHDI